MLLPLLMLLLFFFGIGSRVGYESWEFMVGVSPSSPNPDPIQDQIIVIFHTSFQAWSSFLESPDN